MAESIDTNTQLHELWDETKNGAPGQVLLRSFRSAWWRCPKGHAFQRSPRAMLSDASCPDCQRGPSQRSFAKARPGLV
ncbi:MAG TPA: zinc-ribbon domain-containing protein, partial [Polyangiaceae bacterium]|nr:zinc-ribbon domain-containing protein [Polyangiaceae bacterium]